MRIKNGREVAFLTHFTLPEGSSHLAADSLRPSARVVAVSLLAKTTWRLAFIILQQLLEPPFCPARTGAKESEKKREEEGGRK